MQKSIAYITLPLIDYFTKTIKLLAVSGKTQFGKYIFAPLDYAGWERKSVSETSKKMMKHIDSLNDESNIPTIGPWCKKMVSLAKTESLKDLGDASIYFFEKMRMYPSLMRNKEALEFCSLLYPGFRKFEEINNLHSADNFEKKLQNASREDLQKAVKPISLGKYKIKIQFRKEAIQLFQKIQIAHRNHDFGKCQKLISAYLIRFADHENNNRDQIEKMIDALGQNENDFRRQLEDSMAITLYFEILSGITTNNLRRTILGIKKYTFIFEGNTKTKHFMEIDALEQKLYAIIEAKDLWESLSADEQEEKVE